MILYKSLCRDSKTFHGVTFHFGEVKAVNGYIHDHRFICIGKTQTEPVTEVKAVVDASETAKVDKTKSESTKAKPKTERKIKSKSTVKTKKVEDKKKDKNEQAEPIEEKTQSDKKD